MARGNAGYTFRQELRERYLRAFRAAHKTENDPSVIYINGWWEMPQGGRYRTDKFLEAIFVLEAHAHVSAFKTAPK